jgi:hypothetical protein
MTGGVLFTGLLLGDEKKGEETIDPVKPILIDGEAIRFATKGLRDGAVFTDRRIVVVNVQGLMGKKVSFTTIALKSLTGFTIENSGTFDLDAEIKLYGSGWGRADMSFTRGFDVTKFAEYLANACHG